MDELWDCEDYDALRKCLEEAKVFSENLLYRGLYGEKVGMVERLGTDLPQYDTLMALSHNEVYINIDTVTVFDYADTGNPSAIAVYDKSQFLPCKKLYIYPFKEPSKKIDALVAIVMLNWGK
jgi:hypothetical protein